MAEEQGIWIARAGGMNKEEKRIFREEAKRNPGKPALRRVHYNNAIVVHGMLFENGMYTVAKEHVIHLQSDPNDDGVTAILRAQRKVFDKLKPPQ